ncbi:MAG: hypothetical protein QFX40_00225 [Archaeoglobales archaeon]|nr:hypothetical protein [Archaeoglobales archaeon]
MDESVNKGKLSLDLLVGLSIFLFTFIFVASFLPGVFADVRNEINLAHQAYRIAALLAEDPGYPSDWESEVNLTNCKSVEFRPGLIVFNAGSGKSYNNLNLTKVEKFAELLNNTTCREEVKKYLGLNLSPFGSPIVYRMSVSLKNLSGAILTNNSEVTLNHGDQEKSAQVIKFERIVYLDRSVDNCDLIANRCVAKLEVRIWT